MYISKGAHFFQKYLCIIFSLWIIHFNLKANWAMFYYLVYQVTNCSVNTCLLLNLCLLTYIVYQNKINFLLYSVSLPLIGIFHYRNLCKWDFPVLRGLFKSRGSAIVLQKQSPKYRIFPSTLLTSDSFCFLHIIF